MPWSQRTLALFQERTNQLARHVVEWAQNLDDNLPLQWGGASLYFHKVLVASANNSPDFPTRIQDMRFFERLYACLATWGLERFDNPNARLVRFQEFETQVRNILDPLAQFVNWRLEQLTEDQFNTVSQTICGLVDNIGVVVARWPFVSNAKLLHHLLPHLVPPMDRRYTLKYFVNRENDENNGVAYPFGKIFRSFWQVAIQNSDALQQMCQDTWELPSAFNTTVPKIIDNALVVGIQQVQ